MKSKMKQYGGQSKSAGKKMTTPKKMSSDTIKSSPSTLRLEKKKMGGSKSKKY